jgi:multiple sugar transport system substrate-binding protein
VTTTVRILYNPWDEGLVNALIAAFYQQNAQIRIDKVLIDPRAKPEDRGAQIKAKAADGEVDLIPTYQVPDLDRVALPLDDRLRAAGLDLKPYGQLLDLVRINGTLFQLPYAINPTVIMYNPDLFARAGLKGPAAGWTWGDLRIAAATLTGGPAAARSWGLASTLGNATVAQVMALERFANVPVDPEQAREMFNYWETLVLKERSALPDEPRNADGSTAQFDYFSAGRAGMALGVLPLTRYAGMVHNLMFTPGLAPVPTWPGLPPSLYIIQSSYAVAAGSRNPDSAWQVLAFMAGPEGAQVIAREGTVPAYRSDAAKAAWFEQSPPPPRSSEFLFSLPYLSQGDGLSPADRQVFAALSGALAQVVQGKTTADAAYQQFMDARAKLK